MGTAHAPVTIIGLDEFIDQLVERAGENDPLEEDLQNVLVHAYKGRLLHFAADLSDALNKFACECKDLITCECLKEHVAQWANMKLIEKKVHPEPDAEEILFVD